MVSGRRTMSSRLIEQWDQKKPAAQNEIVDTVPEDRQSKIVDTYFGREESAAKRKQRMDLKVKMAHAKAQLGKVKAPAAAPVAAAEREEKRGASSEEERPQSTSTFHQRALDQIRGAKGIQKPDKFKMKRSDVLEKPPVPAVDEGAPDEPLNADVSELEKQVAELTIQLQFAQQQAESLSSVCVDLNAENERLTALLANCRCHGQGSAHGQWGSDIEKAIPLEVHVPPVAGLQPPA